ncbi:hypothetical protein Dsin_025514 [Dipteronia sinensis]|uniref:Uncharacterized protein n=1 Tax=Dipteronia sinensis TaxID=43782 RepID=A0AAD9ZX33_9ROSI|nr:hypothetical protein Dsin_025514 [Dipteronia sinensis]
MPATTPPPGGDFGGGFGKGSTIGVGTSGSGGGGHSGSTGFGGGDGGSGGGGQAITEGGGGGNSGKIGGGSGGDGGSGGGGQAITEGGGGGNSGKIGGGSDGDGGSGGGGQAISGGGGDGKGWQGFSHETHIVHSSSCSLDVVLVSMVNEKLNWNAKARVKRVSSNGLEFAIFFFDRVLNFDRAKRTDGGVWL